MTREQIRLSLVATWLVLAAVIGITFTPTGAAGWLTWLVLGVLLPVGLWVVTAPEPLTMTEAIRRGRD
ncbi:hypothetical protein [Luteitalea sp.]|jgi:hypothetical protein|uniref:hypothetical protein n=1 Tax=Luteitalea sp. TaxID=2004800 RepID=UPI0037C53CBE